MPYTWTGRRSVSDGTTLSRSIPSSVRNAWYLGYPRRAPCGSAAGPPGCVLPFPGGNSTSLSSPPRAPSLSPFSSVLSTYIPLRCLSSSLPSCPPPASPALINLPCLGNPLENRFPSPRDCIPLLSSCRWSDIADRLEKWTNRSACFFFCPITTAYAVLGIQLDAVGDSVLGFYEPASLHYDSSSVFIASDSFLMFLS